MSKLPFEQVIYNPNTFVWGQGNYAVGPRLLARVQLRDLTPEEDAKVKKDYQEAKEIYEKYIIKGQRFRPDGKRANLSVEAKITFINSKTQMVSWKQDNLSEQQIKDGYKPACGKFSINTMISFFKSGELKFISLPESV